MAHKLQLLFQSLLLILLVFLLAQPIDLVTTDLGRHLKNGQIILQTHSVPETNFYSYTYPNFPFVNHHWGTGVVFYLVFQVLGFVGLSLLFLILSLTTFWLFFNLAKKYANFSLALLVSLFSFPLIASRTEIRPEIFSNLFIALFFWILYNYTHNQKWSSKTLLIVLPLLELVWVNLHIYFFFGILVIGLFWAEQIIYSIVKSKAYVKGRVLLLTQLLIICSLVTLINPAFLTGAIYPLHIFDNYGYKLLENQSIFYLDSLLNYSSGIYFKVEFGLLVLSWGVAFFEVKNKKRQLDLALLALSIVIGGLGLMAVRNFALFGLFAIPLIAINFKNLNWLEFSLKDLVKNYYPAALALIIVLFLIYGNSKFWNQQQLGIGLIPGNQLAGEFIKENKVKGPIFNDYDIGGYLIYYLYPEPVFVDNRPEAYPAEFFQKTYIPMQENDQIWLKQDQKFQFNAIIFNRNDLTNWAQQFLITRIKDPDWAPIYVDSASIIFLKQNTQNQALINQFELPKEMFTVTH